MYHEAMHLREKILRIGKTLEIDFRNGSDLFNGGLKESYNFDKIPLNRKKIKQSLLNYSKKILAGISSDSYLNEIIFSHDDNNLERAKGILNDKEELKWAIDLVYSSLANEKRSKGYLDNIYDKRTEITTDISAFKYLTRLEITSFVKYMKSHKVGNNRYKNKDLYPNSPKKMGGVALNLDKFIKKYYLLDVNLKGKEVLRFFRPFFYFQVDCSSKNGIDICAL